MNKLVVFTLLLVGLVGMIGTAAAQPTTVTGSILDYDERPVVGAGVTVYKGTSCTGTLLGTYTSVEFGYYSISAGELNLDDEITVCAVHDTKGSGSTTTTAGETYSSDYINVAAAIPVLSPTAFF